MKPICWRTQALVTRRAAGLDDAERLLLEEHLSGCERCAADAALLDTMREQVHEAGKELPSAARQRAFGRALRASRIPRAPSPPSARRRVTFTLVAAAGVVALVLLIWQRSGDTPLSIDGTLAFTVEPPKGTTPRAPSVPAPIEIPAGLVLEIGSARIEAREASTLDWSAADDTLELSAGALHVELPPNHGRRFRVATPGFVVEVVGTVFDVDEGAVAVRRGRVRVLEGESKRQLAELAAGEQWKWRSSARLAPRDVAALIAKARRELASGRSASARRVLTPLLAQKLTPRQSAEARSLLAECALVEGDYREAARTYGGVATSHRDTLAGESALFAQARAQMRAGDTAAARSTFQRYLGRYPSGRFQKEAREHLKTLGKEP